METLLRPGELSLAADILRNWPAVEAPEGGSTPIRRLLDAARRAASARGGVGPSDLAVLLRHVLRAADEIEIPASSRCPPTNHGRMPRHWKPMASRVRRPLRDGGHWSRGPGTRRGSTQQKTH